MHLPIFKSSPSASTSYVNSNPPLQNKGTPSRLISGIAGSYSSLEKLTSASCSALTNAPSHIKNRPDTVLVIKASYFVTIDDKGKIEPVPYKPVVVQYAGLHDAASLKNSNTPLQPISTITKPSVELSMSKNETTDIEVPSQTVNKPAGRFSNAISYLQRMVHGRPANYSRLSVTPDNDNKLEAKSSNRSHRKIIKARNQLLTNQLNQIFEDKLQQLNPPGPNGKQSRKLPDFNPIKAVDFQLHGTIGSGKVSFVPPKNMNGNNS
ncbi:hypothetical protein ACVBEF_18585 [Glaciimonas sp. GG7]